MTQIGGLILGVGDFGITELVTQAESYAEESEQLVNSIKGGGHTKIEKYTAENQLPATGSFSSVYFLNVAGSKYLKYWNGTAYVDANTKADLPKCVSSVQRDYYATFADISTANYAGRVASIHVIEDVNNSNGTGAYYFDGTTLNELLLL